MAVVCLGLNHKTAPINIRERFALIETQVLAALKALLDLPDINEAVILSTCNRTEIYIHTDNIKKGKDQLDSYLLLIHGITAKHTDKHFYCLTEDGAIKHLFGVASGLDSMIIGEGQILGQVKQAFEYSKRYGAKGDFLNKLFMHAIKTGKKVRHETEICRGASSISLAAVDIIKKRFKNLSELKILVIGAGKMGYQTTEFLCQSGVSSIFLANRSHHKAAQVAEKINGIPVKYEELVDTIKEVDIIISSTSSPHFILTKDKIKAAHSLNNHRPLFIIDIAVPRDVDPEVKNLKNITLYNIDDLGRIVNDTLDMRGSEAEKAKNIINHEFLSFIHSVNIQKTVPLIQHLQNKYEDALSEALCKVPEDKKEKFQKFGRNLIGKLLHSPIIKIKKLADDEEFRETISYIKKIFD
ncbi:MAG: glutamyl-tRNA reductase [Armatimonadota bacterium]